MQCMLHLKLRVFVLAVLRMSTTVYSFDTALNLQTLSWVLFPSYTNQQMAHEGIVDLCTEEDYTCYFIAS